MDKSRRVFLGETFIPFSKLEEKLKHNEKLQADKELFLKADRSLPYGLVVQIMALAKSAGIDKVAMITEGGGVGEKGAENNDQPEPGPKK